MPSDEVAREVARKLRYYMQVERLEDGFDLTGPELPRRHYEQKRRVEFCPVRHDQNGDVKFDDVTCHSKAAVNLPPLYSGATLHDKSLKFYFRDDSIKHFLRDLSPTPAKKAPKSKKRRKAHVNNLEYHMAQAEFREPLDGIPTGQRPQSLAYKTNVKRPRPGSAFSTGLSTLRRTAPVSVSPQEAHRIVNTAAKLLVATETVAFNSGALQRSSSARPDARTAAALRLPDVVNGKPRKQKRKKNGKRSSDAKERSGQGEEQVEEQSAEPPQQEDKDDDPFLEDKQSYQITVYTGNKRGLASEASVKLKIHGSSMETNWIKLTDSQVNEVKFQKNQKDIFTMETENLGDLVAVQIGHNKAAPGCNWFVDKIEIEDSNEKKIYVFENNDWIPHSKTASIGLKKLSLSRVVDKNQTEITTKASREDPASDLPSSSLSTPKSASDRSEKSPRSRSPSSSKSRSSSRSSRSRSSSPNTVVSKTTSRSSSDAEKEIEKKENGESLAIVSVPSTTESHSDDEKDETTTSTHETQAPELTNAATKDPESPDKEDAPKEETDKSPTPTPPPKATSPEEPEKPDEEASKKTEDEKEETQQDSVAAVVVVQDTSASVNVDAEQEKVDDEQEERKEEPEEAEEEANKEEEAKKEEEANEEEAEKEKEEEPKEQVVEAEVSEEPVPDEVDKQHAVEEKEEESISSEEGFLEELNLIENSRFIEEDKQPEFWIQYGGCTLNCVEVSVPFSDNKFACEVTDRSATFSGIAQNISNQIEDYARYKITAQVRLGDSSPTAADKIQCVLQYKLDQADSRFQQMKITEVAFAKATSWSYLVGWVELSLIQKNHKMSAARLCFEGPAQDVDFLVTNVKLSQEIVQGPTDQVNIIKNGSFDQFTLTPKNWKGVGQAILGFSDMFHGGKRGCMTLERPFAYSGIAQSVLDIVEHGRHYSFTAYVRLVGTPPEESHNVRWVLKYNAGDSKGDLRHVIAHAENVTSKSWSKMNGELNMLEIKSSTGRPVLSAVTHKSSGTRHKDEFGAPLEYCTFHFETTANVNLCVAGPRMIDGGKIAKPAHTNGTITTAAVVTNEEDKPADGEKGDPDSSSSSSSESSEDENEPEKKDEEKVVQEGEVAGIIVPSEETSPENETAPDTVDKLDSIPIKLPVSDEFSELSKLHAAVEKGDVEGTIAILRGKPTLVDLPEPEMKFTTAHVAAVNRKGPMLKVLNDFGVDFNATSKSGYMAIHYAALNNDVDTLTMLHSLGASLNELTVDRHTPLHVAAKQGNKEAVKWLLINGCVLNYRDNLDRTPADMASLYGHETIAALIIKCVGLLKQNRDIIDTINDTDLYSSPVYHYGPPPRSMESNKTESSDKQSPFFSEANQNDDDVLVDKLHAAIAANQTPEVQSLLEKYPQLINLPSRKGFISIHVATDCKNPQLVRLLSRMGAELSQPNTAGYFPLHQAVLNDDIPTLNALFALGVSLNAMTPDRQTALHLAAERGMLPLVKWLISNGAILNHRNSKHQTPAEVAIDAGFNNIASLIKECVTKLKSGQDVADVLKVY